MSDILKIVNLNRDPKKKLKIHKDLPHPPFRLAAIGPTTSGKSNFIRNLLTRRDMLFGVFHYIFIFCPSIRLNDDFIDIEEDGRTIFKFDKFDEMEISNIQKRQTEIAKIDKKRLPRILLLLDDCFDDDSFSRSNVLKALCFRGRHANISLIFSGQKLSSLNRACRLNLSHMAFFRPNNFGELDFFLEENIEKRKRKEFSEVFKGVWQEEFAFVWIDYNNRSLKKRFRNGLSGKLDFQF